MTCVGTKFTDIGRSDTNTATVHAVLAPALMRHSYHEVYKVNVRLLACVDRVWCQPVCLPLSQTQDANLGHNGII